jgi:CelD/BcsL family acetyltransferase involved in cellulose biosynthesis
MTFFDWDDPEQIGGNTEHIRSAGYSEEEVEHVLLNPDWVGISRSHPYPPIARGTTPAGEVIFVPFEVENSGDIRVIRPVTAFLAED